MQKSLIIWAPENLNTRQIQIDTRKFFFRSSENKYKSLQASTFQRNFRSPFGDMSGSDFSVIL